jgi:hypothetical protein
MFLIIFINLYLGNYFLNIKFSNFKVKKLYLKNLLESVHFIFLWIEKIKV